MPVVSLPLTHPDLESRLVAGARRIGYPVVWPSPAGPCTRPKGQPLSRRGWRTIPDRRRHEKL